MTTLTIYTISMYKLMSNQGSKFKKMLGCSKAFFFFAKFCACGSNRETEMPSQKILQTEVGKVWRECGFLMRFGHSFTVNTKQDKITRSF